MRCRVFETEYVVRTHQFDVNTLLQHNIPSIISQMMRSVLNT